MWDVEREEMRRPSLRDLWLMGTWHMHTDERLQKTHKGTNLNRNKSNSVSVGSLTLVPKVQLCHLPRNIVDTWSPSLKFRIKVV